VVVSLHYTDVAVVEAVVNVAVSVVWLVLTTNAVNLVDIMDGLAGSVALVAALFLAVVAALNGRADVLCVTAALAGALLGFLRFNRHPARIYMGDTGALFLGFMLGALGLVGSYTMVNRLGFLAPIYILAVPIFDTTFVSAVRLSRGASPSRGSPDHFAIRLKRAGWSVPRIVASAAAAGTTFGLLGVASVFATPAASIGIAVVALLAVAAASVALLRIR
jgi:UDP-GlcNAc:undecaprenyl-phosphate GlcNAc-1-phosphate transferase